MAPNSWTPKMYLPLSNMLSCWYPNFQRAISVSKRVVSSKSIQRQYYPRLDIQNPPNTFRENIWKMVLKIPPFTFPVADHIIPCPRHSQYIDCAEVLCTKTGSWIFVCAKVGCISSGIVFNCTTLHGSNLAHHLKCVKPLQ